MQDKESIMVDWSELKIRSIGIAGRHHSASLAMPNGYPRDRIFSPHLTIFKDSNTTKMNNVRTYVKHEYEVLFCPSLCCKNVKHVWSNHVAHKNISCICTFLHNYENVLCPFLFYFYQNLDSGLSKCSKGSRESVSFACF